MKRRSQSGRSATTRAPAAPFAAGLVQMDIRRGNVKANLRTALRGLTALARRKARLAVLPEMWTSGMIARALPRIVGEADEAHHAVRRFAQQEGMVVIGSSYEREGDALYNTAFVFDADGTVAGQYRKIHLFSPGGEHRHFEEGATPLVASTAVGPVGVTICYDLRFPELYRGLAEAGARIIVVPAQWPTARLAHWETLLAARAIENQVYVIGCNRVGTETRDDGQVLAFSGGSAIVDPWGTILARRRGRAAALTGTIDPAAIRAVRERIPVWKDRRPVTYRTIP